MSLLPLLPAWVSGAICALVLTFMFAKLVRRLPVELRFAVINWRALVDELRRGRDGR
jgi:hypothetical protein